MPGTITASRPASRCQSPFVSKNSSQPRIGPPSVRHFSPRGQGVALQSCALVTEQRFFSSMAGATGFKGFRISIAVRWTSSRVTGVWSRRQPVKIVFPTVRGSRPRTGDVMSTIACTCGGVPSTKVVRTLGLRRRRGVWSITLMRRRPGLPAGRGGKGMSNSKLLALTFASGCESGKHSVAVTRSSGFAWCVTTHRSPAPPPPAVIHTSVRVARRPPLRRREKAWPAPGRLTATACGGWSSLW